MIKEPIIQEKIIVEETKDYEISRSDHLISDTNEKNKEMFIVEKPIIQAKIMMEEIKSV